ncbi:peptidase S10 [Geomonas silvestris]|uniref:Peptidase S10 n=1 Tax=Geomonas silvestris TaxID=2740184 RepID=A0A6V8MIV9_9BACT|nr:peptidase S10 [Geomonas silvestris]
MSRLRLVTVFLLIFVSAAVPQLQAAQAHPLSETKAADKEGEPGKTLPITAKTAVTRHKVSIGGKEYSYTATASFLPLTSEAGEPEAEIFSTSYTIDTPQGAPKRPIMFVFNGGPGAASAWLHLGALGPRRVEMLPDGNLPAPPFRLVDNGSSWLDLGDLVFVDPVGTGYSRAGKPDLAKGYASVRGDIESLLKFVRLYLTRNERWSSPVYLVGESYGTFRCAGMADQLAEHGVALNGIILISSVLNFQTISFDNGNDLPYQLFLPSYTATAWYHKKLAPELMQDLERTVTEAENWAGSEYQLALNKGDRLTPGERREVVAKLSRYTGLSPAMVDNLNLRIDGRTFVRELLRDQRRTVGYMDSRFNAANVDPAASSGFDPTVTTIRPPYTSLVNNYLREELGFKSDLEYYTLGGGIGHWDWETKNGYADTSDNLRNTMAKNPYMKVFVASGLFDLATPHFATDYTLAHLGLTPPLRQNITTHRYRSGHMMYLEKESLAQLKRDVADFIAASSKAANQ